MTPKERYLTLLMKECRARAYWDVFLESEDEKMFDGWLRNALTPEESTEIQKLEAELGDEIYE